MTGVGNPIEIPPEKFSARKSDKFTEINVVQLSVLGKNVELSAPDIEDGAPANGDFGHGVNVFPEFSFEKMSYPQYGTNEKTNGTGKTPIARYTGVPYVADFIKDYNLISIMRLSDKLTTPAYAGKIKEQFESPSSSQ